MTVRELMERLASFDENAVVEMYTSVEDDISLEVEDKTVLYYDCATDTYEG